jgi:hypothetical protein
MSLVPFSLLIINICDFINLWVDNSSYPFSSEFVITFSIYRSETVYIIYNLLFSIILLLTIYFAFIRNIKMYLIFVFLCIALFYYPIFTASNY